VHAAAYIHDGHGQRLAQVPYASLQRTSMLSAQGMGEARVQVETGALDADVLDAPAGRLLVVESDVVSVPWVGPLTSVEASRERSTLELRARSYGAILRSRHLGADASFRGPVGDVLAAIVDAANSVAGTGVAVPTTLLGGPAIAVDLPGAEVGSALDDVADLAGWEWWIEAQTSGAQVALSLAAAPSQGRRAAAAADGGEISWTAWSVDSEAALATMTLIGGQGNALVGLGDRPSLRRAVAAGKVIHGATRQVAASDSPLTRGEILVRAEELKGQGLVDLAADALAGSVSDAGVVRRLELLVVGGTDWDRWAVGNVVDVRLPDVFGAGFEGPVRVLSFSPLETAGIADLVVEVLDP